MRGTMTLLDPSTGLMECAVCGARHVASIRPASGGQFYRGSWQFPDREEHPEAPIRRGGRAGGTLDVLDQAVNRVHAVRAAERAHRLAQRALRLRF